MFYLVLSSVRFPADQFCWRPIAGVFALRFCAGPLFRAFFRKAFSARSFAGLSPWVIPRCTFRANFRMDGFHGLFREVVYSVLSGRWIFGSFFPGLSPCNFLQGRLQWELLRGAFFVRSFARVSSVQFSAGTFYLHCLVGSFYVLFLLCAFPVDLFAQLLSCSLSWGCFPWHSFAVEISIGSYPGDFPVRFFAVAFSARSFAEVFAARFFAGVFFTTAFRKLLPHSPLQGFSRGLFAGASLVLSFAWTVSNICSEGHFQCPLSPNIFQCNFFRAFSVRFFDGKISMGSIAGAFSVHSLMWRFYPALFCKGDIHKLLRGGNFRTIISSASFRALYR